MAKHARLYTLKEFMEADTDAAVSVKAAEMGYSEEQVTATLATLAEKRDADDLLTDPEYSADPPRRTWDEWVERLRVADDE